MALIIYLFLKLSPRSLDWNLSRSEGRADRRFTKPESATIAKGVNPRSEAHEDKVIWALGKGKLPRLAFAEIQIPILCLEGYCI